MALDSRAAQDDAAARVARLISFKNKTKSIHRNSYDLLEDFVTIEKGKTLGVNMKGDLVKEVKELSPCREVLMTGDILVSLNGVLFGVKGKKNKEDMAQVLVKGGKVTIRYIRMKRRKDNNVVYPPQFTPENGYSYEWAVMYNLFHLKLGITIRDYEGKAYISEVAPCTQGSMSFNIGEAIIDIDGALIDNAQEAEKKILDNITENGSVRALVEIPLNDQVKNILRWAFVIPPPDDVFPLPADIFDFAEEGVQLQKSKAEPKSNIFRDDKSPAVSKRLSYAENASENPIFAEASTQLLLKCLPMKTAESEAAAKAAMEKKE